MIQLPPPGDDGLSCPDDQPGQRFPRIESTNDTDAAAQGSSDIDMLHITETLRKTKAAMQRVHDRLNEPLAVVGIGCRFPDASGPDEYWDLLNHGRSAETVAGDRWDESLKAEHVKQPGHITANRVGWLDGIDQFDASFFGISGREAASLDPQQRLLLEIAWETFEHAGIIPQDARGKRVGAFVGICSNDYFHRLAQRGNEAIDTYLSTGNAHGAAAGRLSYVMDWRGPSVAVDTACSSSLTAIHLATRSLRYGDCDMAIAMGVNVILAPELSISFSQAGMLSPTGRCHTFSTDADGFVRGEGCGAVLLKRYRDAIRDGDTIHCLVRGSATNQDGRSIGLTAPNGTAQQAVIRDAIRDARMTPQNIDYVEAHGTGTPMGDPIEVDALRQVFAPTREDTNPLRIGSAKTNIGHLEGASGIAGFIKVALAIKNSHLPSHLNCDQLSDSIDWQWPVEVTTDAQSWDSSTRVAGISSFGFGGSNAHVILSAPLHQNPLSPSADHSTMIGGELVNSSTNGSDSNSAEQVFVLSAKTPGALRAYAACCAEWFQDHPHRLRDICYSAATAREAFDHRLAWVVESTTDLQMKLLAFADGSSRPSASVPTDRISVNSPDGSSLHAIADAFQRGETIQWTRVFRKDSSADSARRIDLPTYPFQRSRRWMDDAPIKLPPRTERSSHSSKNLSEESHQSGLLNRRLDTAGDEAIFETDLGSFEYLHDHVIRGSVLFPASGFVELALSAAVAVDVSSPAIENLVLKRPITLATNTSTVVQVVVIPIELVEHPSSKTNFFRCRISLREKSGWTLAAECVIRNSCDTKLQESSTDTDLLSRMEPCQRISSNEHYDAMHGHGLHYGFAFEGLNFRTEAVEERWCMGETGLPGHLDTIGYEFHPAWLDACFQVAASVIPDASRSWVPIGLSSFELRQRPVAGETLRVIASLSELLGNSDDDPNEVAIDMNMVNNEGIIVAEMKGMRLTPIAIRPDDSHHDGRNDAVASMDSSSLRIHLHERIADIMGLAMDEVPMGKSLDALGLDSLMAFELRDEIQSQFQIEIPLELFFESITLERFLDQVLSKIAQVEPHDEQTRQTAALDDWVEGAL